MFWVSGAFPHPLPPARPRATCTRTASGRRSTPVSSPPAGAAWCPTPYWRRWSSCGALRVPALPPERLDRALLVYPTVEPAELVPDVVVVTPYFEGDVFSAGSVPSAGFLFKVDVPASYHPFSATLSVPGPTGAYRLETTIPRFAPDDMLAAAPAADPAYLQLPEDLPSRVLELARPVRHRRALLRPGNPGPLVFAGEPCLCQAEGWRRRQGAPPPTMTPVDWFLFERRWGDSSHFSSAFVVLARAAGIPARVVAGWAIESCRGTTGRHRRPGAPVGGDRPGRYRLGPLRPDAHRCLPARNRGGAPPRSLVEELESSDDPQAREEAAETLGDLGEPEALPALIQAAEHDESLAVQLAAESAIHKIGIDELIWLLLNHEDPVMREAAADGLRVAGSYRGVDALRQALATDVAAPVRVASAEALAKIGGQKAEEGLLKAVLVDEEAVVREAAVLGLGKLRAVWAAEDLVPVLRRDPGGGGPRRCRVRPRRVPGPRRPASAHGRQGFGPGPYGAGRRYPKPCGSGIPRSWSTPSSTAEDPLTPRRRRRVDRGAQVRRGDSPLSASPWVTQRRWCGWPRRKPCATSATSRRWKTATSS